MLAFGAGKRRSREGGGEEGAGEEMGQEKEGEENNLSMLSTKDPKRCREIGT